MLGLVGITPSISDSDAINLITTFVNVLAMIGIVVDPTTEGISDSDRARAYEEGMIKCAIKSSERSSM